MASGRSWGEGRREEGSITLGHKEQLHTYVHNDAVEAHSCVDSDSGSPCKQLTKTLGRNVLLLSNYQQLCIVQVKVWYTDVCGTILLCVCIRMCTVARSRVRQRDGQRLTT